MTAHVALVQHGDKHPEPGDPGLTAFGRAEAARVARALTAFSPAVVVAGPLRRARLTAEPIAAAAGLPLVIDQRLSERMNLEPSDDPERFIADWRRSTADRAWCRTGSRTSLETAADMLHALEEHAVDGRTVVLVGHGGATVDLLRSLLGDELLESRAPGLIAAGPSSCAVTHLRRSDRAWCVEAIADTRYSNR